MWQLLPPQHRLSPQELQHPQIQKLCISCFSNRIRAGTVELEDIAMGSTVLATIAAEITTTKSLEAPQGILDRGSASRSLNMLDNLAENVLLGP